MRKLIFQDSLLLALFALCLVYGLARADDYRLDRAPTQTVGTARVEEPYERPEDPAVCKLYLENLRYFAKRNTSMSCERPIAPHLRDRIRKVEWEDLDPEKHRLLFRAVVSEQKMSSREPIDKELAFRLEDLKRKVSVFRRAKLTMEGFPIFEGEHGLPSPAKPIGYQIIQYGINDTDPNNPDPASRCKSSRGSETGHPAGLGFKYYTGTEDLSRLYGRFALFGISASSHLRMINNRLYLERSLFKDDIQLMEIKPDEPNLPRPVCLYRYKKTSFKGK